MKKKNSLNELKNSSNEKKIVQMSNIFTRLNYCSFQMNNSSNGSSSNEIASYLRILFRSYEKKYSILGIFLSYWILFGKQNYSKFR